MATSVQKSADVRSEEHCSHLRLLPPPSRLRHLYHCLRHRLVIPLLESVTLKVGGWVWLGVVLCGFLWLGVVGCGWVWLGVVVWLNVVGCGFVWLCVVGCGWVWLCVVECDWMWLSVAGCGWM